VIHALRTISLAALVATAGCVAPAPPASAPPAPGQKVTELRVLPDGVDARPLLAPHAARATAAGAGPLRVIGADVAAEGDRIGAFVEIPDDECMLAFSRPSPTIADVDLFAFEDDGSTFAADESPEAEAAIVVCPPHPRRLYVVARVMAGSGIVGVGVQSVPRAAADAVAQVMNARGRPGEDSGRLDAWPGLEAKIRAHRESLGGRWEDVRRLVMPVAGRAPSRVSAAVEANRCLDVLVTPSEEVSSLEVVAEDAEARVVARGREHGRDRSLLLCAAQPATVSIAVRPRASQGLAAVVLARSAAGAEPELAGAARVVHLTQTLDLEAARRALAAELGPLGYGAPRVLSTGSARLGVRAAAPVDLPAGCARLDVIAGKPLAEVAAALWDDHGALLVEGRGGASVPLFTCGRGGAARLDLEARESPGPFSVELRADRAAPAALVAHPVAAGRLLVRLAAGGAPTDAAAAAGATVLALDDATLRTVPVPLPPGGCAEVLAALDTGGSGLDLRLVDASGEGTVTRSRYVAAGRLCAPPGGKTGSAELRLSSGKADALLLVRPE
jgi:hypothetical protein